MKKAVFLDRDGTIVEDLDFLTDLAQLRLLPHAAAAIRELNQAGILAVLATNQSGVARGFLSERDLAGIHEELQRMLGAQGARLDALYYCPHHPTVGPPQYRIDCDCRKPKPGLFVRAGRELGIDLSQSFGIGDSLRDAEAARSAGLRAVLVRTGPGSEEAARKRDLFYAIENDLLAAVRAILREL